LLTGGVELALLRTEIDRQQRTASSAADLCDQFDLRGLADPQG
jgi:hypothetical protein